MMPAARATLALLGACTLLPRSPAAARLANVEEALQAHTESLLEVPGSDKDQGLSGSLLEASSGRDDVMDSRSGKRIFEDFFADPAAFSKPGPVSGDLSCGHMCSSPLGDGSRLGKWRFIFGAYSLPSGFLLLGDLEASSFNGGENLIVEWEGNMTQDATRWAPTFGGWSTAQFMVDDGIGQGKAKGPYHILPDLGMGDNVHEVFGKMCAPGGADGKEHEYVIPMHWDGMREMVWLEDSASGSSNAEKEKLARMKPFQQGLLALKYTCEPPFEYTSNGTSAGMFSFRKIAIYLTK